jgi:hypothetical protein
MREFLYDDEYLSVVSLVKKFVSSGFLAVWLVVCQPQKSGVNVTNDERKRDVGMC